MPQSLTAAQTAVIFRVGHEEYGVRIDLVQQILAWSRPIPAADASPLLESVLASHDQPLKVVDLRHLFQAQPDEAVAEARAMVLLVGGEQVAMVVDQVIEVSAVASEAVSALSPVLRWAGAECQDQIVTDILSLPDERLVMLVEPLHIMAAVTGEERDWR